VIDVVSIAMAANLTVIVFAVVLTWCCLWLPRLGSCAELHAVALHFKPQIITFARGCMMLFNQTVFLYRGYHSALNKVFQTNFCVSK
jgi:hypothetical protein